MWRCGATMGEAGDRQEVGDDPDGGSQPSAIGREREKELGR
jgi:hypothetical protein